MTVRRTVSAAASVAALGVMPLALTLVTATPATAHGSMSDPVSRVAACYAEGPENPQSAACKAAVAASGTQAFYDWNEVNIPNAAGRHQEIIPDGELCSAGREKYRGLDLPRADWPATRMSPGAHTFHYRATAPHRGAIELYLTEESYDPAAPLTWSDLEEEPFAKVTDPQAVNGEYVFEGEVPERSGRHLVYSIWQRSDSPEAFYTCSDVVFGGEDSAGAGAAGRPEPSAPTEEQITAGRDESTVDHGGHGGDPAPAGRGAHRAHGAGADSGQDAQAQETGDSSGLRPDGGSAEEVGGADEGRGEQADGSRLAATGAEDGSEMLFLGGAAAIAAGAGVLLTTARRRAVARRRG